MNLLKSIDNALYEIMAWLVFYPITLWRSLRHPARMMDYADTEMGDVVADQYSDSLSPPTFLVITLVLSHWLELAFVDSKLQVTGRGHLFDTDQHLLVFRAVLFSVFPLIMAIRLLTRQGTALNRETLRPPFFSQCYVAAPFALTIGIAGVFARLDCTWAATAALALIALAFLWYARLQANWFAALLGVSWWRGAGKALFAIMIALVLVIGAALLGSVL